MSPKNEGDMLLLNQLESSFSQVPAAAEEASRGAEVSIPPNMPERKIVTGKFVPLRPDERLLFVGQDVESIREYGRKVDGGASPSGVTTYTGIRDDDGGTLNGLDKGAVDYGAGVIDAATLLREFPKASISIGLDLVGALPGIVAGKRDDALDNLADFITKSGVPVFLRIGYEFDGPWNQYAPEQYKLAFRRIVDHLRKRNVENFCTVWQSATSGLGTFEGRNIWSWYPGDGYVDWFGLSYFVPHKPSLDDLLSAARYKNAPVMICESAPQGYDLANGTVADPGQRGNGKRSVSPEQTWNRWFSRFFQFIRENYDVIRAVRQVLSISKLSNVCCC